MLDNTNTTYGDFAVPLHDADLDVLRSCLDNLQQALDSELDGSIPT